MYHVLCGFFIASVQEWLLFAGGGGALQVFVQVQSYVIAQRSPC